MADNREQPNTHITDFKGRFRVETSNPNNPVAGDLYFNTATNYLMRYTGSSWIGALFSD